jgi:hypothetical protein
MALTNFPGGVTSFGVPVLSGQIPFSTGTYYFLDSSTGSNSYDGKSKETPFATLDYAIGKCTANKGDVIIVMPGHAETITGAGGITVDIAGISIIGLGSYDLRPAFLMDGGTSVTMLVTAANCTIQNIVFRAGHADIVKFGTITAKGCRFINCVWEQNATAENWLVGISVGAADNDSDGFELLNSSYFSYTAGADAVIINKNQNDVRILSNTFVVDNSVSPYAVIYAPDTEIMFNILVADNVIHNFHDANAAVGIAIANTSSTGSIVRNLIGHQDVAGDTPILAGAAGLFVAQNYCSGVLGTASGYLYPGADS